MDLLLSVTTMPAHRLMAKSACLGGSVLFPGWPRLGRLLSDDLRCWFNAGDDFPISLRRRLRRPSTTPRSRLLGYKSWMFMRGLISHPSPTLSANLNHSNIVSLSSRAHASLAEKRHPLPRIPRRHSHRAFISLLRSPKRQICFVAARLSCRNPRVLPHPVLHPRGTYLYAIEH